ncbi:MAG: hypothetical protein ACLP05_11200 [Candidatus Kryptoniota bacterium]
MERIVNKAKSHKDAEEWDVAQQVAMAPEQRQEIAKELRERFFGVNNADVRHSGTLGKQTLPKK